MYFFMGDSKKWHNFTCKDFNNDAKSDERNSLFPQEYRGERDCEITFQPRARATELNSLHKRVIEADRYRFIAGDKRSALPSENFPIIKSLKRRYLCGNNDSSYVACFLFRGKYPSDAILDITDHSIVLQAYVLTERSFYLPPTHLISSARRFSHIFPAEVKNTPSGHNAHIASYHSYMNFLS